MWILNLVLSSVKVILISHVKKSFIFLAFIGVPEGIVKRLKGK